MRILLKGISQSGDAIPIPAGYHETIITPKASRKIEAFWSFTAQSSGQSLVLPDGRCDVILRGNSETHQPPVPVITGPATQAYTVTFEKGDRWIGARMRPENGKLLWAHRIGEVTNTVARADAALDLFPALSKVVQAGFSMSALTLAIDILTGAQEAQRQDQRLLRAVDIIHITGGRVRVDALAHQVGCSSRNLTRLFRANIGLAPKPYAQLVQFHRGLHLIQKGRLALAPAAFEAGFADHAHLTRAFRKYAGLLPSKIPQDLSAPQLFA
ncbi:MAG: helix-turn-helix transcriptional regulator [Thalassovita sp.]